MTISTFTEGYRILKEILHLPPPVIGAGFIAVTIALLYWHWVKNRHLFDGQRLLVEKVQKYVSEASIVEPSLKEILAEERDEQVFAHVFGYRLDVARRKLLHAVVKSEVSPVSWWTIKRAKAYIKVRNGQLVVEIPRIDLVMHYIQLGYALLLVALMVLSAALAVLSYAAGRQDVFAFIAISFVTGSALFVVAVAGSGVGVARTLKKWLDERVSPDGRVSAICHEHAAQMATEIEKEVKTRITK